MLGGARDRRVSAPKFTMRTDLASALVVDAGASNIGSMVRTLKLIGCDVRVETKAPARSHERLIVLPGVGAFDQGVRHLADQGWNDFLAQASAENDRTVLGVCLGMQLLCEGSSEGAAEGIGLIPGRVVHLRNSLPAGSALKTPHAGWNDVHFDPSLAWAPSESLGSQRFFFAHSYHYGHGQPASVMAEVEYGIRFPAAVGRERVIGFQFHPERSQKFGMNLLAQVLKWAHA